MDQGSLGKKKGIVDIVFLIDATGSMAPCLDALKKNIGFFVDRLTTPDANASAVITDWRIKVCGYRDAKADGTKWWEEKPFTTDQAQAKADLGALMPEGGGDEPESLLDALWKLIKMPTLEKGAQPAPDSWRDRRDAARCVIVFTDASCHMETASPEAGGAKFADVAREAMAARLRLSVFCPEADCYHELASIDKAEVEFVGSLSDAREKMGEFTSDQENFKKVLAQLTKSITASADPDLL